MEGRIQKIAKMLSDKHGVKVVFRGNECKTDGKTIWLPSVKNPSPELVRRMESHLDHEAAHVLLSDFSVVKANAGNRELNPYLQLMEDIRIEGDNGIRRIWPGCGKNFDEDRRWMFSNEVLPNIEKIGANMDNALWLTSFAIGSKDEEVVSLLPKEWVETMQPMKTLLESAHTMKSTQDAVDAAKELLEFMQSLREESPEESGDDSDEGESAESPESGESAESAESPESGDEGEEEGSAPDSGTESGDEEGEEEESPVTVSVPEDEDGDEEGEEEGEETPSEAQEDDSPSFDGVTVQDLRTESLKALAEDENKSSGGYAPYTTEHDRIDVPKVDDTTKAKEWFRRETTAVKKESGVMIRRLARLFKASKKVATERNRKSGKLDTKNLARFVATGDSRVFKRRLESLAPNTRVTLLLDASGSMSGSRVRTARRAAVAFGVLCDRLGLPFEVLSFTTDRKIDSRARFYYASDADKECFTRWGALKIDVFKAFGESWKAVGHRLHAYEADCHNYDGEALAIAAQRLRSASKAGERNLILVFSDGQPEQALSEFQPAHKAHLKDVIKKVEKSGTQVVAIGIEYSGVRDYYNDHVVCHDLKQLTTTQIKELEKALRK